MKCEKCGHPCQDVEIPSLQPIIKLSKDAIAAIRAGSDPEASGIQTGIAGHSNASSARILVDLYYTMQDVRKAMDNKDRAHEQGADPTATHEAVDYMAKQVTVIEDNARTWLQAYVVTHPMWPWLHRVPGIGPVLSAGLVAHLGAREIPPTVGHWWRFAGLDPSQRWLGQAELKALWDAQEGDVDMRTRIVSHLVGRDPETVIRDATTNFKTGEITPLTKLKALKSLARIPYNRPLKTLCWKIGDSMVKLGNRQDAFYAVFYRERKATEIARNQRGDRAELAAKTLQAKPNHAKASTYREGLLPDGRVDMMARRATVKLFLSHLHELWYRLENGKAPPHPFSTTIKGHAHYIAPPYQEALFGRREAA